MGDQIRYLLFYRQEIMDVRGLSNLCHSCCLQKRREQDECCSYARIVCSVKSSSIYSLLLMIKKKIPRSIITTHIRSALTKCKCENNDPFFSMEYDSMTLIVRDFKNAFLRGFKGFEGFLEGFKGFNGV